MRITESIDALQYQQVIINVLDRLMDFYVILYAAKTANNEIINDLTKFKNSTESFFINAGFTKEQLAEMNTINEAIDIFQTNYSYCRTFCKPVNADDIKMELYQDAAKIIYEINSGNRVEVNDFIEIHSGTPEEQTIVGDYISYLRKCHPCLHLLRIVDVVDAPALEDIIPLIDNAISSYRPLNGINSSSVESACTIKAAIDNIIKLAMFYPERLYVGLRYVFPQYSGPLDHSDLALSINHSTSNADIQCMLDDITFQLEKFKVYYHNYKTAFNDDFRLERLKPLMSKPVRNNKYIKQFNSIEGTFHALLAWQKKHLDKLTQAEAIDMVYEQFNANKKASISADAYKKKIRDRLEAINEHINAKKLYLENLSERIV